MTTGLPATITVDVAWGSGPNDSSPTWTNIPEVTSVQIGPWGRTYELDQTAPTPATIIVDSSTGTYSNDQRWNLCDNPSFEVNATGWSASLNCSVSRSVLFAQYGSASLEVKLTSTGTAQASTVGGSSGIPVTPGVTMAASMYVRAGTTGRNMTLYVNCWDSGGAFVSTLSADSTHSLTSGSFVRVGGTFTVPAGIYYIDLIPEFHNGIAGENFYIDGVLVEQASSILPYFDGTTLDGSLSGRSWWNGTVGSSASTFDSQVTIDSQIRVQAGTAGGTAALFNGVLAATPTKLDSGVFEYATTTFGAVDRWDAMGCVQLRSALVEQTIAQSPTAYYICNDTPGTTQCGEAMSGSASGAATLIGTSLSGSIAWGATSLCEPQQSDPTTSLSFAPHSTSGANDGGYYVPIALSGAGAFLTGTQWTLRAVFGVSATGTIFCQTGSSNPADGTSKAVLLQVASGFVRIQYPHGGVGTALLSPTSVYADGKPHTVEARMGASGMNLVIDGVSVATNAITCDSLSAVGPTVLGVAVYADLGNATASSWFQGRLGHVALFDSTFAGAWSISDGSDARKGYPADSPSTRLTRLLRKWAGFNGTLTLASSSVVLGVQECSGATLAEEILKVETATQGLCMFLPAVSGSGGFAFVDGATTYTGQTVMLFGTDTNPVDMTGLVFEKDRQHLVNDITATRPNGPTIRLTDSSSINQHGRRTAGSTIVFYADSDANLLTRAQSFLSKYSKPRLRVGSISIDLFTRDPSTVLNYLMVPSYKITVTNLPASAPAPTMDFIVESVSHSITPTSWVMTLALAPFIY